MLAFLTAFFRYFYYLVVDFISQAFDLFALFPRISTEVAPVVPSSDGRRSTGISSLSFFSVCKGILIVDPGSHLFTIEAKPNPIAANNSVNVINQVPLELITSITTLV